MRTEADNGKGETMETINKRMLEAKAAFEANRTDPDATFDAALTQYMNVPCTMDDEGDVHCGAKYGQGHWWHDEYKAAFLEWLATR